MGRLGSRRPIAVLVALFLGLGAAGAATGAALGAVGSDSAGPHGGHGHHRDDGARRLPGVGR